MPSRVGGSACFQGGNVTAQVVVAFGKRSRYHLEGRRGFQIPSTGLKSSAERWPSPGLRAALRQRL